MYVYCQWKWTSRFCLRRLIILCVEDSSGLILSITHLQNLESQHLTVCTLEVQLSAQISCVQATATATMTACRRIDMKILKCETFCTAYVWGATRLEISALLSRIEPISRHFNGADVTWPISRLLHQNSRREVSPS